MSPATSWRARALLLGLALAASAALVALAEALLRAAGIRPPPPPAVMLARIDPFVREGNALVRKPALADSLRESRLPARKPPGTVRVFCLGGSMTFGYPYAPELSWPSFLERRLRSVYPGRSFEVVNLGGTSFGSGRAVALLRGILPYSPDVVVVASGNNEFVEDSFRTAAAARGTVGGFLDTLSVAAAVRTLLHRAGPAPPLVDADGAAGSRAFFFTPVLHGEVYTATPEKRAEVRQRFGENLAEMAALAERHRFRLVVCTLPSNVETWAPGDQETPPPGPSRLAAWQPLYDAGVALEDRGRPREAIEAFRAAERVWDGDPHLAYRLGRLLLGAGSLGEARERLIRARDLDAEPVRATGEINGIVRETARARRLPLADLEKAFEQVSPGGIVGDRLMLDHAHPTPAGNALAAATVWRALAGAGAPWSAVDPERAREADRAEAALLARPAAPRFGADLAFAWGRVYAHRQMYERAIEMFDLAAAEGYDLPYAGWEKARILYAAGDFAAAEKLLTELATTHPDFEEPLPMLADLLARNGRTDRALPLLRRLVERGSAPVASFRLLADLLVDGGELNEALAVASRGLERYPADCPLSTIPGRAAAAAGDVSGAVRAYRGLTDADPGCQNAWEELGTLLMNEERWPEARATFLEALAAGGDRWPAHRLNLGYVHLLGEHDRERAVARFREYLRLDPAGAGNLPRDLCVEVAGADACRASPATATP